MKGCCQTALGVWSFPIPQSLHPVGVVQHPGSAAPAQPGLLPFPQYQYQVCILINFPRVQPWDGFPRYFFSNSRSKLSGEVTSFTQQLLSWPFLHPFSQQGSLRPAVAEPDFCHMYGQYCHTCASGLATVSPSPPPPPPRHSLDSILNLLIIQFLKDR